MSGPELKALIWDVDGTLAETERDGHRVAFNQAFTEERLDWHWSVKEYGRLLAITGGRERMFAYLRQRDPDALITDAVRQLIERVHRRKNLLYASLVEAGQIDLRPGVLRMLREAREAGLRQAIATTTSRSNVEVLLRALLGSEAETLFEVVICGEDVRRKKPDPEVYSRVLAVLDLDAANCVAVEDSAVGLSAAGAAGIACLLTRSIYTDPISLAAVEFLAFAVVDDLEQDHGNAGISVETLRGWHRAALDGPMKDASLLGCTIPRRPG